MEHLKSRKSYTSDELRNQEPHSTEYRCSHQNFLNLEGEHHILKNFLETGIIKKK